MKTEINVEKYKEQVSGPGQFKGEPPITAYLWEASLNGDGGDECISSMDDGCGHYAEKVSLYCDEMEAFDTEETELILVQDSQGFVMTMTLERYENWK